MSETSIRWATAQHTSRRFVALSIVLLGLFGLLTSAVPARADLCVTSLLTNSVLRYDETTGVPSGTCAAGGGLTGPRGVAFGPDGNVYVSNTLGHNILRFDGKTGAPSDVFVPVGSGGLFEPQALTFGPDGNLYVVSFLSVLRYDGRTGAFLGTFASPIIGGPTDLAFSADGTLYVSTFATVQRFHATTGAFIDFFGFGRLLGAFGMAFGPDGLYVGSNMSSEVVRFDPNDGTVLDAFPCSCAPLGLAFGPDGRLYVSSRDTDSVLRFEASTGSFVDTFIASGSGGLDLPVFLAFGPTATATSVIVDVKPETATNPVKLSTGGVITVAILSSSSFDASGVDATTVCFGDDGNDDERDCSEAHGQGHVEDVDGDGRADLVLHFELAETGIDAGDTSACLTGETAAGERIEGCDSILTL